MNPELLNDARIIKPYKSQTVYVKMENDFQTAQIGLNEKSDFVWILQPDNNEIPMRQFPLWKEYL